MARLSRTPLTAEEFEALSARVLGQTPHMSVAQILDLADQLHDAIRARRNAERTGIRRAAEREPPSYYGF